MENKVRIYTRTGDAGTTSLYDGTRVGKGHPRIEALGAMDELTSYLGVCRHHVAPETAHLIQRIQKDIYHINSAIAAPAAGRTIDAESVSALERMIDNIKDPAQAPDFIHVGSSPAAAHLHYARTICRRAERSLWHLTENEPCAPDVLKYVNRLSDLLYALAVSYEARKDYLKDDSIKISQNEADQP